MPAASRYKLTWVPTATLPVTAPLRVEEYGGHGLQIRGPREAFVAAGIITDEILDGVGRSGHRSIQTPVGSMKLQRMADGWRITLWPEVVSYLHTRDLLRKFNVEARPEGETNRHAMDWLFCPDHHYETYC